MENARAAAASLVALLAAIGCGADGRLLTGDDGGQDSGGTGGELPEQTPCWSALDCEEFEICDLTEATPLAAEEGCHLPPRMEGVCVPRPRRCGQGETPGEDCVLACEAPPASSVEPQERWTWTGQHVMTLPILTQLDDDDCDGKITDRDLPDLVFSSFPDIWHRDGSLHAVSIIDGELVEKWTVRDEVEGIFPSRQLAAGDLDGEPGAEIVACTELGHARAHRPDGSVLWTSSAPSQCYAPSIADLDRDGAPEVITSWYVYDGQTGAVRTKLDPAETNIRTVVVSHLDGDSEPEIVGPDRVYSADGELLASVGLAHAMFLAVGDLDQDGVPEVVSVSNDIGDDARFLHVWQYDPSSPTGAVILRSDVEIQPPWDESICFNAGGGGPPILADFDGDGFLDVGVPGRVAYSVFDGLALLDPQIDEADALLWRRPTFDCSSGAAGASVFDLDGDGTVEVIHADQNHLRVFAGPDGALLHQQCNSNGTALEYPLVADVDHDGHAEIVVSANAYYPELGCAEEPDSLREGIRIFEAPEDDWRATETIWNQHAHHVTNVMPDGRIPVGVSAFWAEEGYNAFRRPWPHPPPLAPNLVVSEVRPSCADGELLVTVRNLGEAPAPAGVEAVVRLSDAPESPFAATATPDRLAPLEEVDLRLSLDSAPAAALTGASPIEVVLDPEPGAHDWAECRTADNTASLTLHCEPS